MLTWASNIRLPKSTRVKLGDRDPERRKQGLEELAALPHGSAIKVTLRALDDPVSNVREAAIFSLSGSKSRRALKLLVKALRHKSPKVRFGAATALGVRAGTIVEERSRAFDAVSAALNTEHDRNAAVAMAMALHNTQDSRALDKLLTLLRSRYSVSQRASITALMLFEDPLTFDPLAAALKNSYDAGVMKAAATALASLGDPRAVDEILCKLRGLSTSSTDATFDAMFSHFLSALRHIEHPGRSERLILGLDDGEQPVRCLAAMALGFSGDVRAEEALKKLLSDKDPGLRRAAESGLQDLKRALRPGG